MSGKDRGPDWETRYRCLTEDYAIPKGALLTTRYLTRFPELVSRRTQGAIQPASEFVRRPHSPLRDVPPHGGRPKGGS